MFCSCFSYTLYRVILVILYLQPKKGYRIQRVYPPIKLMKVLTLTDNLIGNALPNRVKIDKVPEVIPYLKPMFFVQNIEPYKNTANTENINKRYG